MTNKCKLCGSINTIKYHEEDFSLTGNSNILARKICIWFCEDCCNFFKIRSNVDMAEVAGANEKALLYDDNVPEHRVAFDRFPLGIERSALQLEHILSAGTLRPEGRILDFGCHYGNILKRFSAAYPAWHLTGFDVSEKFRNSIESIHNKAEYIAGDFNLINKKYNFIILASVLGYVIDPFTLLNKLSEMLNPGGYIYVHQANAEDNPFASFLFECHYHFTPYGIRHLLGSAGFRIVDCDTSLIPKEISIIAAKDQGSNDDAIEGLNRRIINQKVQQNKQFILDTREALNITKNNGLSVVIFGSEIVGTWAGYILGKSLKAFVDENKKKQGQEHIGVKIISPDELSENDLVYVMFPANYAERIINRLSTKHECRLAAPPHFSTN